MLDNNRYIDELALIEFLGIKLATARDWRFRGKGPKAYKFGRCVRYNMQEVIDWAVSQRVAA